MTAVGPAGGGADALPSVTRVGSPETRSKSYPAAAGGSPWQQRRIEPQEQRLDVLLGQLSDREEFVRGH